MRLLKAFLVGATGLFIIITLFSFLIPSQVRVSRAVLISNTSPEQVYQHIANFNNWKQWHPIFTIDSADLYSQPPSGYRIIHRGNEVIIKVLKVDSTLVKFVMFSAGENDIDNEIVITPISTEQSVQVEWRSITKLRWYPWDKFYGIFIDKLIGPGYENALNSLKNFIEKT